MSNPNIGLALPVQVEAIEREWARVYGANTPDGSIELHDYTGRTHPRHLTKVEARMYLGILNKKPTRAPRPPITSEQLAARVARL